MLKAVAIGVAVVALAAGAAGQSPVPPDRVTLELLNEVKALRADVNRASGSGIRAQLLVARLQLQEQRILTVVRQIDDVKKELAGVTQARASLEAVVKQGEDPAVAGGQPMEKAFAPLKQQLSQVYDREQQLRQSEAALNGMLADEQARWTEFSTRLDDLERVLIGRH